MTTVPYTLERMQREKPDLEHVMSAIADMCRCSMSPRCLRQSIASSRACGLNI